MTMTFSGLVSVLANGFKAAKSIHSWATDARLKQDFEGYLAFLEKRRVLYAEWEYEKTHAVLASLSDIQHRTVDLRSNHSQNTEVRSLLGKLISTIQASSDIIRGCDMHTTEGEFMAFKALIRFRSEMANALAILCGRLAVSPSDSELKQFIMNMALVRPKA
jgi:hypothetical protein